MGNCNNDNKVDILGAKKYLADLTCDIELVNIDDNDGFPKTTDLASF